MKQSRGVMAWRFRFFIFLFGASLFRIAGLFMSVWLSKPLKLTQAKNSQEFFYQLGTSIPSLLFFSAFTCIIWFFAHMTFQGQAKRKRQITPFFVGLNVFLYILVLTVG